MCVKFPTRDLNLGPYPPHHTNTYTCEATTPNMLGYKILVNLRKKQKQIFIIILRLYVVQKTREQNYLII